MMPLAENVCLSAVLPLEWQKKTETTADAEPVLRKCYLEFWVIRGYILAEAQKSGRY